MPDKDPLEQAVQDFILDVCEVMHKRGFDCAPVGAIMRLAGVPENKARDHDHEHFVLDEDFEKMLYARRPARAPKAPAGTTLH